MAAPDPAHPAYAVAQRIQRERGRELLRRHGAHALGIEWVPTGRGDEAAEPVLVFHVSPDGPAGEAVPSTLTGTGDDGTPRQVATRVRHDPPATSE